MSERDKQQRQWKVILLARFISPNVAQYEQSESVCIVLTCWGNQTTATTWQPRKSIFFSFWLMRGPLRTLTVLLSWFAKLSVWWIPPPHSLSRDYTVSLRLKSQPRFAATTGASAGRDHDTTWHNTWTDTVMMLNSLVLRASFWIDWKRLEILSDNIKATLPTGNRLCSFECTSTKTF